MNEIKHNQEAELILGRLEKEYILKKTNNKEIWLLSNIYTGQKYVGKFQSKSKLDRVNVKNVLHEASFLQQLQGHSGVPLMYWSGVEGLQIILIVQYLGFTLGQRLKQCQNKLSLKSTCMIGIGILKLIRNLHEKGVIHRNINPNSIQFGRGLKSSEMFINDMIDCKKYRNKKSYAHIPSKKGIKYTYENIYGSQRFQKNQQTSRIDDIQNLIKVLIRLNTGVEPNKKGDFINTKIPTFLHEMLKHCQTYDFSDEPNYQWFNQKLLSTLFHYSYENDGIYDWMIRPSRVQNLRVNKNIINLKLDEDKQLLAEFYDPYEQSIDIDQVTTKYQKFYRESEGKVSQNPIQSKKSMELQLKIRKRKTIQRERQKPDCSIL